MENTSTITRAFGDLMASTVFRVVAWVCMTFLMVWAIAGISDFALQFYHPYKVPSGDILSEKKLPNGTPVVPARSRLAARYHVIQTRQCEFWLSRFVTETPPFNAIVQRDQHPVPAGANGVGDWPNVVNYYSLGENVTAGQCYVLKGNVTSRCSGAQVYQAQLPSLRFCVED